ncbi:hypothetical protein ACUXK4_004947 [Methylorubrum extorquens]
MQSGRNPNGGDWYIRFKWQKGGSSRNEARQRPDIVRLPRITRDTIRFPLEALVAGP